MCWLLDCYGGWFSDSYRPSRSVTSEGSITWCGKCLSWAERSHTITNVSLPPPILLPYRIYCLWDQLIRIPHIQLIRVPYIQLIQKDCFDIALPDISFISAGPYIVSYKLLNILLIPIFDRNWFFDVENNV
jgi:hypothetical protein